MSYRLLRRRAAAAPTSSVGGPNGPARRTFRFTDIKRGWLVSDCDGVRLGTIADVGETMLAVWRGLFLAKLYVPPSAVGEVREGLVTLNVTGPWIVAQGWDRPGGRRQR